MSDDQSDIEPGGEPFDTDLGFDDSDNIVGDGKKPNPLIKIGLVVVALVAVIAGAFYLTRPTQEGPKSEVASAPTPAGAPAAGVEPTPEMRQALETYNQEQIQKAEETGGSALPIPVDPLKKQIETKIEETAEDPAERFRRIQEEYRRQQEQQAIVVQQQQKSQEDVSRAEVVDKLAQAMSQYLQASVSGRAPKGMEQKTFTHYIPTSSPLAAGVSGQQMPGSFGPEGIPQVPQGEPKVLIPATTIEYGQLMIEANTDSPGPVLAMMVTGKLAGSRLLGSFQKTDEFLTINFNQLVTKQGKSMPVSAIVLDPDTTLPGVITEIDRRYFQRIVIPAAAEFIAGVGSALAETQTTTNQNSTTTETSSDEPDFSEAIAQGINDSFSNVSDALDDELGDVQPMLRVAAGTPIGILFTSNVIDPSTVTPQPPVAVSPYGQQPGGQMFPGPFPPGFSGVPMAGYPFAPSPYGVSPQQQGAGGVPGFLVLGQPQQPPPAGPSPGPSTF